ncbi:MAG TPA: FtsX-like permease family protein [Hyphomonadaceae bacterium]|jgi:putative ABC transport system permease protein|nr:FtsX-like permease family protein [Hyphomonadaceae bacterium]
MLANYLATALSNLARNWLYAAISIFGLAVSFAGAILVAQFVRNEFSYDRWIPGYENVYALTSTIEQPGQPPFGGNIIQASAAKELEEQFPKAIAARLRQDVPTILQTPDSGDGGTIDESFAWADADYFKIFPLPTISGDLATALDQPDSVVLTEKAAKKYFGRTDVLGATLTILLGTDKKPQKVTAVLKDFPSNTTLVSEIIATGKSTYSPMTRMDMGPPQRTNVSVQTFVRVQPGVTREELQNALNIVNKPSADAYAGFGGGVKASMGQVPLADTHLTSFGGLTPGLVKPTGSAATALGVAAVGALIVLVAGINFVTLMTARASRRAIEVGIRKANGATRGDLVVQFMGEALIYAVLSMIIAVVIASLLAQPFSDFVQRGLTLDFLGDPMLSLGLVGATLIIGILGGFYPALVLSSFKPGTVLKGGQAKGSTGSSGLRNALVVVQFAILIGLIISTITIYQQTRFALAQGLGEESDLIIQVRSDCANAAFIAELRKLPAVDTGSCSSLNALSSPNAKNITDVPKIDGSKMSIDIAPVHFDFFETYDIEPVAGRLFERNRGVADNPPLPQRPPPQAGQPPPPPVFALPRPIILNETAVRQMGYASPQEAIGKQMIWRQPATGPDPKPSEIIGVVPDLPVTISATASPTVYFVIDGNMSVLSIRAKPNQDLPFLVTEIQRLWKATNNVRPIRMTFYSDYKRTQYLDIIIQGTLIGICAAAAIVIACLGLFALSAFAAERRTKEIGVRKALGATTSNVLALLMWQFTVPVLVAIAIALPLGYLAMAQWLQGYTYHIDISPWVFALAAGVALAVAWITVSFQTLMVAQAKPVKALRYE